MRSVDSLIAALNSIDVGELGSIRDQLGEVRAELARLELEELVGRLDECLAALGRGDVKNFRRLKETVVSRLGHLR